MTENKFNVAFDNGKCFNLTDKNLLHFCSDRDDVKVYIEDEIDQMTLLCNGDAEAVTTKPSANLTGSLVIFSNEKQNREDDTGVH